MNTQGTLFPPAVPFPRPSKDTSDSWHSPTETPKQKPEIHWLGEDGLNVFVEIQGQFAAIAFRKGPKSEPPPLRGEIKFFSPASRLRMFKIVNRLDWKLAGRSTFTTLTFPDTDGRPTAERLTQIRSDWQRRMEKLWSRPTAGIWRVEWEKRKSGRYVGEYMPHVHNIHFGCTWLDKREVKEQWRIARGSNVLARIDIQEIANLKQALYYVSKYVAKAGLDCSLVIPSYLNKSIGRQWGKYRRELLPLATDKIYLRTIPGPVIEEIRAAAIEAWSGTPFGPEAGFTMFGPASESCRKIIDRYLLSPDAKFAKL